jgi:protein-disulfide isomerase
VVKPLRARLLMTLWVLTAAGCSGEQPSLTTSGNPAGLSVDQSTSGSAFPDATGQKAQTGVPSPFAGATETTPGGRQIIVTPTIADVMMSGPISEMSLGKANAPVTITQYASLTCPHCRAFHATVFPQFKREYIDTGKVRYILREFPIGQQSGNATIALRCAPPDKYFALYGKFMEQQSDWVSQEVRLDPIFAVAKQVGLSRAQFDACYQNQAMIEGLKWVKERGRTLGIIGTPNFFIGNKLVKKELTIADIRAEVDPLISGSKPLAAR